MFCFYPAGTVLDRQIGNCRELDSNMCASGFQRTPNLMKKINRSSGLATRHPCQVFNLAVALVLIVAFATGPKVALAKCEQEAHNVASLCGGTGIHEKCCFALKSSLDTGDSLCLCSLANNREVAERGLNSTRILSLYQKCGGHAAPVLPAGGCEEITAFPPSPPPLRGFLMPPPPPPAAVEPVVSAPMVGPPPPPAMIAPFSPSTPVIMLPPPPPVTTVPSTPLLAGASATPPTGVKGIYHVMIGLLVLVAIFLVVVLFVVVRKYCKPQLKKLGFDIEMGSPNAAEQLAAENAKKAAAEAQSSAEAAAGAAAGSLATAQAASEAAQAASGAAQAANEEVATVCAQATTVQANATAQAAIFVEALGQAAHHISSCAMTLGQVLQHVVQIMQMVRETQGGAASAAAAVAGLFARFGELFRRAEAAAVFVENAHAAAAQGVQAEAAQGVQADLIDMDCANGREGDGSIQAAGNEVGLNHQQPVTKTTIQPDDDETNASNTRISSRSSSRIRKSNRRYSEDQWILYPAARGRGRP